MTKRKYRINQHQPNEMNEKFARDIMHKRVIQNVIKPSGNKN